MKRKNCFLGKGFCICFWGLLCEQWMEKSEVNHPACASSSSNKDWGCRNSEKEMTIVIGRRGVLLDGNQGKRVK